MDKYGRFTVKEFMDKLKYLHKVSGIDIMNNLEYICGVHFCEICGDCMYCYGGDPCIDDGEHYCEDGDE